MLTKKIRAQTISSWLKWPRDHVSILILRSLKCADGYVASFKLKEQEHKPSMRVREWNDQKVAVVVFQIRSTSSTGISPQSWISRLALDLGPWTLDLSGNCNSRRSTWYGLLHFGLSGSPLAGGRSILSILSLQFTRWRCGTSRNGSLDFRLPQDQILTLSNTGLYCKAGLFDCPTQVYTGQKIWWLSLKNTSSVYH